MQESVWMKNEKLQKLITHWKVGYFSKQGFIKEIGLAKSVYDKYIKEYVGATIMHCHLHQRVQVWVIEFFSVLFNH